MTGNRSINQRKKRLESASLYVNATSENLAQAIFECLPFTHLRPEQIRVILTPYVSHLLMGLEVGIRHKDIVYGTFEEFYNIHYNSETERVDGAFSAEFFFPKKLSRNKQYFLCVSKPNLVEKILTRLKGITLIRAVEAKASANCTGVNELTRAAVSGVLRQRGLLDATMATVLKNLPVSLLEGLSNKSVPDIPITPVAMLLGQIHSEHYLFLLSKLKLLGTKVLAEPHGGIFFQFEIPTGNEVAEYLLSDDYLMPRWLSSKAQFAATRPSRNLYLNLFQSLNVVNYLTRKRIDTLVILPNFYFSPDPGWVKFLLHDLPLLEFIRRRLFEIQSVFNGVLTLRFHPWQSDESIHKFKKLFGKNSFEMADRKEGLRSQSFRANRVIHLAPWFTSLMELESTRIHQFTYVGEDTKICHEYQSYLNSISQPEINTLSDFDFVSWNRRLNPTPYLSSYLYPLTWISNKEVL